jgi:hypothetical protein
VQKPILLTLCAMSVAGVGASLWAHAVSLAGVDPQSLFQKLWIFQLILLFLLLPLGIRAIRRGVQADPFGLPRVEWRILGALVVYYAGHFYFFMIMAAEHLHAALTWQMFSAGWILMFMLTTFYYWTRFAETRR